MDGREPQRFSPLVEDAEVATCGDHAEIKINDLLLLNEHGLHCARPVVAVQVQHLAPDELAAHSPLDDGIQRERQRIKVLGLHVCTQDAWRVLEELLRIDYRHEKVSRQIPTHTEACKAASNNEDAALRWRHGYHKSLADQIPNT